MFKVISKLNISHRYQKRNLTISYPFEATEFWKKNEQLIKKRKNDDLLFVFFEGVPGCGKHDVLNRLNKFGYTIWSDSYYEQIKTSRFNPSSRINSCNRISNLISRMEENKRRMSELKHKDNIIFINRSPLSGWTCSKYDDQESYKYLMNEIKEYFNTALIYCLSDDLKVKERLAGRMFLSDNELKVYRNALGENDEKFQEKIKERYELLRNNNYFDDVIHTTDTKQAQAQVFTIFDLQNWDSFKMKFGRE